jgi:sigma-E factor negative regulatory protein RseA
MFYMKINSITQEKISALVDGEYPDHELDSLLGDLRLDEHKSDWEIYHRIGEILNSDELSVQMSADFSRQLATRLEREPVYLRPKPQRIFLASHKAAYAVAAAFVFALVIFPKFAGQDGAETSAPYYAGQFSVVGANSSKNSQPKAELAALSDVQVRNAVNRPSNSDARMLRDPLLDSYLAAHQHYSNSMYSTAEYEAGSTTTNAGK